MEKLLQNNFPVGIIKVLLIADSIQRDQRRCCTELNFSAVTPLNERKPKSKLHVSIISTVKRSHSKGLLTAMPTLSTRELCDGRSRLFAPGCWPAFVMFAEIDLSMNAGDICSAQFNHMPVLLLLLFPNKLHHFSTTSPCLACPLRAVLMQTVAVLEKELQVKGGNLLTSDLTSCYAFRQ